MKFQLKLALTISALALAVSSATALAAGRPADVPPGSKDTGQAHVPVNPGDPTPGPRAGLPAKAKAYGRYCKDMSKRRGEGRRSDFSLCVTAMARVANNSDLAPGRACRTMSRRHVKGERGTDFRRCVNAAAKLRRHQHDDGEAPA